MESIIAGLLTGLIAARIVFRNLDSLVGQIPPLHRFLFPSCIFVGGVIGGGMVSLLDIHFITQIGLAFIISLLMVLFIIRVGIRTYD